MDAPAEKRSLPAWTAPLLVAAVTALAFLPVLRGGFLNWDDDYNFVANPNYRGLSPSHLRWMFTTFALGHYHPLAWVTLGFDYVVWGMNPFGYHLTSLLIHAANAAILFLVLELFLRLLGRPLPRWPAFAGALFYALHPLRVESVAWITERRDVLCGFFALLCVFAYLRRAEDERAGKPASRWLVLSVAAFAASLLSKALSITLPAVLLILDVYPLGRFAPGSRRRVLLEKLPYMVLSCADAAIMFSAMRSIDAVHAAASYNPMQRAAQVAYGLAFYVVKTIWPSGLAPLYRIEPHLDPAGALNLASMAAVAGLSAFLLVRRRRLPGALAAWVSTGILVFPVLGVAVTGMQIAADRYTYLAALPASVLIAGGLGASRAAVPVSIAALSLLAGLTVRQAGVWRDSVTLWTREVEIDPLCALGYGNRGQAHLARGEWAAAIADYDAQAALEPPKDAKFWHNRGVCHAMLEKPREAEADYARALEADADYIDTYVARAQLRAKLGDAPGAGADFDEALRRNPRSFDAWRQRGLWRLRRDSRGAAADLTRALELRPDHAETWADRGLARALLGDAAGAMSDLDAALRLQPGLAEARQRRGIVRMERGDVPGAIADFEECLKAMPPESPHRARIEEFLKRARRPQ